MKRKVRILLVALLVACSAITANAQPAHCSVGNPTCNYRDGFTVVETTYCGTDFVPNYSLNNIEAHFGTAAKEAYLEASRTGDFYNFRTMTGCWKPITSYDVETGACDIPAPSATEQLEDCTFDTLGKYATIQDYLAWCQKEGYNDPLHAADQHHFDVILGKRAEAHQITKAEYLAAHKANATATAAAPANNSKIEALKKYKGNNNEFNAYAYYNRYTDLQAAFGPNGDLLKKHWNEYGKKEGRIAK